MSTTDILRTRANLARMAIALAAGLASPALAQWNANYTIQRLGLLGAEHTGTGGFRNSDVFFMAANGTIGGVSYRYSGPDHIGQDAWIWNGTSTVPIGLSGPLYTRSDGFRVNFPQYSNASGHVAGTSGIVIEPNPDFAGFHAWAWDGVATHQIGLVGGAHSADADPSGPAYLSVFGMDAAGRVLGNSARYNHATQQTNGADVWIWNGSATQSIALAGPEHTGTQGYRFSYGYMMGDSGKAVGGSQRIIDESTSNGNDTWFWNGTTTQQIGLFGPGYISPTGLQQSSPTLFEDTLKVAGESFRIDAAGVLLGRAAWVWNGTTTQRVGLTDAVHTSGTGHQVSSPQLLNSLGHAAGSSIRYTGTNQINGSDAWVWNGTSSVQVGLVGGHFTGLFGFQNSGTLYMTDSGQVTGLSSVIFGVDEFVGTAYWVWNGSTTQPLGLSGPFYADLGGIPGQEIVFHLSNGMVAGTSNRWNSAGLGLGKDAWVWNGTATEQVGLFGATHTGSPAGVPGHREIAISQGNDAGQFAGVSKRYHPTTGQENGENVWLWNAGTTQQIGLTSALHTGSDGYQRSGIDAMGSGGHVVGWSKRIALVNDEVDEDAWLFDPATSTTILITPPYGAPLQMIHQVRDDGVVLGTYYFGTELAFVFHPVHGFISLGDLVEGGLFEAGWHSLANAPFATENLQFAGIGMHGSQTIDPFGQSAFVLIPGSDPTCPADLDDGSGTGSPDNGVDVNDLLFFLTRFEMGDPAADLDDGTGSGTPDNGVDVNDLLFFLAHFEGGC
jgi:hypothetical protein